MSRCNSRTRDFIWLNRSQNRGFSEALVDLARVKRLTESERELIDEFKSYWSRGRDLHSEWDDLLKRFRETCDRRGIRISFKKRFRPSKEEMNEYHRTVERYSNGRPKQPFASMYDAEWSEPEENGSYWPPFRDRTGTPLSREERRAIVAEFRVRAMREHAEKLDSKAKGKKKVRLIPGKLLATDSVIEVIPWTQSVDVRWHRPNLYTFGIRTSLNADNDNRREAA